MSEERHLDRNEKAERKQLVEINNIRKILELNILKPKIRECLRCGKIFESVSPNNRLCGCLEEVFY